MYTQLYKKGNCCIGMNGIKNKGVGRMISSMKIRLDEKDMKNYILNLIIILESGKIQMISLLNYLNKITRISDKFRRIFFPNLPLVLCYLSLVLCLIIM